MDELKFNIPDDLHALKIAVAKLRWTLYLTIFLTVYVITRSSIMSGTSFLVKKKKKEEL